MKYLEKVVFEFELFILFVGKYFLFYEWNLEWNYLCF